MMESEFKIQRGISDNYPRQLLLANDFIQFENGDKFSNRFLRFDKAQIAAYCFGINWMRYYFTFGREYIIKIRSQDGSVITINFKTYFGRRKKEYHEMCNKILSEIYEKYFRDIEQQFIEKFKQGEEFQIGEVLFLNNGIILETNSSLKIKRALIPWEKIGTRNYATYFALYAEDNAYKTNRGYSYLTDWNTPVLKNVIQSILEMKNLV